MAPALLVSSSIEIRVDGRGENAYLELHGQLDHITAPQFALALADLERSGIAGYVVDLSGLTFLDVAGVRAILDAVRRATRSGREISLRRPTPDVRRLLSLAAPELVPAAS